MLLRRLALTAMALSLAACSWSMRPAPSRPVGGYHRTADLKEPDEQLSCTNKRVYPWIDVLGTVATSALAYTLYSHTEASNQRRQSEGATFPVYGVALTSVIYAVSAIRGFEVAHKCDRYLREIGEIE